MEADYSYDELTKFMDYVANKGLINAATAGARKSATKKVLSTIEENERADLRNLSIDEVCVRFTNLYGSEYSPGSLQTYQSRFKATLEDFFNWKADPGKFSASAARRSQTKRRSVSTQAVATRISKFEKSEQNEYDSVENVGGEITAPITFPIPIRGRSVIVRIAGLPNDLTGEEAEKVAAVLGSLRNYLQVLASSDGQS